MVDPKDYSIVTYLQEVHGMQPVRQSGQRYHYRLAGTHGPDTTVFERDARWHCFSDGTGGRIFDLVQRLEGCGFVAAKERVDTWLRQRGRACDPLPDAPARTCLRQEPIVHGGYFHPALLQYAESRGVGRGTLAHCCRQVDVDGFFYIGLPNDKGGWCLRNSKVKRNHGPSWVSWIPGQAGTLEVFEGMFDLLTFKELAPGLKSTCLCLNSVNNLKPEILQGLMAYGKVRCWLDSDKAGSKALEAIRGARPDAVDMRHKYAGYSDLNAWHVSKNLKA